MNSIRYFRAGFLFVIVILFSGCATFAEKFAPVEKKIQNREFNEALKLIEKEKGPDRDQVLYLFNKGMILRMDGDFAGSNDAFEQAKSAIDKFSAISVTEQAGAVTVNDAMRAYAGAPFEQVLLHIYKALNYLELNESDAARVEVLQADTKLQELGGKALKDEAFPHYFMGMVFEMLKEYDDALIAYRHAYDAYKAGQSKFGVAVPDTLKSDLLRLTKRQNADDEFERYKKEFEGVNWIDAKKLAQQGEFIIAFQNDLAPIKGEQSINTMFDGRLLRIAVPFYPRTAIPKVDKVQLKTNTATSTGSMVQNIDATARTTLDDEMPGVIARTAARVVVKHKTADKLGERNGGLGLLMNIFGFVSERADTRSWVTLPSNIHVARLPLDPGTYDIEVLLLNREGGQVGSHSFRNIVIDKGKKVFRSYHWVAGH